MIELYGNLVECLIAFNVFQMLRLNELREIWIASVTQILSPMRKMIRI